MQTPQALLVCVASYAAMIVMCSADFGPTTRRFLTSIGDLETPSTMHYFLGDVVRGKVGGLDPKSAGREMQRMHDSNAFLKVYGETADGRRYIEEPLTSNQPIAKANFKHSKDHKGRVAKDKQRQLTSANVNNRQENHVSSRLPDQKNQQQHRPIKIKNEESSDGEEVDKEFVPTRMYAQVRKYESKSHLPRIAKEQNLRKIVHDSRIHTVYMEEGYEDDAFDHASEEKHAEEDEAQTQHRRRRRRRNADIAIPNVNIDMGLISNNPYAFGQREENMGRKYPYYERANINSNSPLRYAQAFEDIPYKKAHQMAFYDSANAKTRCDEIMQSINPIPKDLNYGEEAPKMTVLPNLPRLNKLGDQIDCYKIKYFGEMPLDNPLFREGLVEQPEAFFTQPEFRKMESNLRLVDRVGRSFKSLSMEPSEYPVYEAIPKGDEYTIRSEIHESQNAPDAQTLRMQQIARHHRRPQHQNRLASNWNPTYESRLIPSPSNVLPVVITSAPPTTHGFSEVYYKHQIKPSEQLTVFTDVINQIQNMSRNDALMAANEQQAQLTMPLHSPQPYGMNSRLQKAYRKNLRRKYPNPNMISKQQLYAAYLRHRRTNPSRIYNDFAPLMAESSVNVGQVQGSNAYNPLYRATFAENIDAPRQYTTIDLPLNKYTVLGMKPPLANAQPALYSAFRTDDTLRRRGWFGNLRRLIRRRRGTRNNYSEIRRQPTRKPQETAAEEEAGNDEDDYVPHRSTNYHYDPDTDRIIYDKPPSTEKSVEEIIDEYFDEEPEKPKSTTTKKPPPLHKTVYHKDVLNSANGKTLVEYLITLKSDPSYKLIEDPATTAKPSVLITSKPVLTTPPEFIKLLEKLHSSDGYKQILDPQEKNMKTSPKTTTAKVSVQEEPAEEEAAPVSSMQNSPGGQFGGLEIFDINAYLPKVKAYAPRTSIDYSKYKTIERTTPRHSLSSRYSDESETLLEKPYRMDDGLPTSHLHTPSGRPTPMTPAEDEKEDRAAIATVLRMIPKNELDGNDKGIPRTSRTSTTTTLAPKSKVRGRPRSTRRPMRSSTTISTTVSDVVTTEATREQVNYTPATHRAPSRVYPRRQRPKIRLRSTTTSYQAEVRDDNIEESSDVLRRIVRRQDHPIPTNHKYDYTRLTISKRIDDPQRMSVQRQVRLVTPDSMNHNQSSSDRSRPGEINPRAFALNNEMAAFNAAVGHNQDVQSSRVMR